jgi:adenine-specific DNA-methyltransferase
MSVTFQPALFPDLVAQFSSTRYQGSKAKLADWIWERIADLEFDSCLDAFGGTGAVAYRLKQARKEVTYNDLMTFNYYFGQALIENSYARLSPEKVDWLLTRHPGIDYPSFVVDTFSDIYFTDEENVWIDQTITNIRHLEDEYQSALAFYALCQACIVKRPYNLFHRKNLYIRFADVDRSFGNKTSWDRPFAEWFTAFVEEANQAVFDNGRSNRAFNLDALAVPDDYDLVYIDTPYISAKGVGVDYRSFYHFLEGLTIYDEWGKHLDRRSKHLRLKPQKSVWADKQRIYTAFDQLFARFNQSILVVSYRSDGIPSEAELVELLKRYKPDVRVEHFGRYQYVLSTNSESKEILLIGY